MFFLQVSLLSEHQSQALENCFLDPWIFLNPQISHIHSGAVPSCIPLSSCKAPKRIKCFWPADDLPFLAETVAVTVELLNPREHKLDCFCSSMVMH